mmetsp:Transcript_21907/g.45618  ORF Transcript_21907/g.45618 Transcript_21907/m.45618 type:complete len:322 (+) Transcript_21907:326-1291(+)
MSPSPADSRRPPINKITLILLIITPLLYMNFYGTYQMMRSKAIGNKDYITHNATNMNLSQDNTNTAIIITSSWVPSHPSTRMIDKVIDSRKFLVGLPSSTPIFITVDGIPEENFDNFTDTQQKLKDLDGYTTALFHRHLKNPNVHILVSSEHLHIGGSVFKAMTLIQIHYPSVEYLYYLQHDFNFVKEVDHLALVDVMEKHPSEVNYIRFKYQYVQERFLHCGNLRTIKHPFSPEFTDGLEKDFMVLEPSKTYSDNNHFVRFQWYFQTILSIKNFRRPPEGPLQRRQGDLCAQNKTMGLYVYQPPHVLRHLDGRGTPEFVK